MLDAESFCHLLCGSPCFYSEAFVNAMTIVRHMEKPDYFITITPNPRWLEIVEALRDDKQPQDRPDLCVRVFKLKLDSWRIFWRNTFQDMCRLTFTCIEWQKRGPTHCHILLIMANAYKPRMPEMIDMTVSAELPGKDTNLELFQMVTKHMLHGPCGHINPNTSCMEQKGAQRVCTEGFAKMFTQTITILKIPTHSTGSNHQQMLDGPIQWRFKPIKFTLTTAVWCPTIPWCCFGIGHMLMLKSYTLCKPYNTYISISQRVRTWLLYQCKLQIDMKQHMMKWRHTSM